MHLLNFNPLMFLHMWRVFMHMCTYIHFKSDLGFMVKSYMLKCIY